VTCLLSRPVNPKGAKTASPVLERLKGSAGRRSLEAADILKNFGYDVRPLKPGYRDLIKAGFESDRK
jgi:hypothetical protein